MWVVVSSSAHPLAGSAMVHLDRSFRTATYLPASNPHGTPRPKRMSQLLKLGKGIPPPCLGDHTPVEPGPCALDGSVPKQEVAKHAHDSVRGLRAAAVVCGAWGWSGTGVWPLGTHSPQPPRPTPNSSLPLENEDTLGHRGTCASVRSLWRRVWVMGGGWPVRGVGLWGFGLGTRGNDAYPIVRFSG